MRGSDGRGGLHRWPERLEAGGHARRPSALAPNRGWLLSCRLSLATPPNPRIALRHAPLYADRYAQFAARMYTDNPVSTAPYLDFYAGQRLGMRGTVMGREASRALT